MLTGTGIWSRALRYGDQAEAADAAAELEGFGYGSLWVPDVGGDLFGAVGVAHTPPRLELRRHLHGQAGPLIDPARAVFLRRAFAQIHAIGLQADIARHRQARHRAGLHVLREGDGRRAKDAESRQRKAPHRQGLHPPHSFSAVPPPAKGQVVIRRRAA